MNQHGTKLAETTHCKQINIAPKEFNSTKGIPGHGDVISRESSLGQPPLCGVVQQLVSIPLHVYSSSDFFKDLILSLIHI